QLLHQKTMAERAGGGTAVMQLSGASADGTPFAVLFFSPGGLGVRSGQDGLRTVSFHPNRWNIPVEVVEQVVPIAVDVKELLVDSGGPGESRGGLGQRVVFRLLEGRCWMSGVLERTRYPASGVSGGLADLVC